MYLVFCEQTDINNMTKKKTDMYSRSEGDGKAFSLVLGACCGRYREEESVRWGVGRVFSGHGMDF